MKIATPRWRTPFVLTVLLLLAGLLAPTALAVPPTATASITPSSPPAGAGATESYTFSLAPTSGQISSFNLTAPSGWSIQPLVAPPTGVTRPSDTQIQGRSLSISASSPFSLNFSAQAPCSPASATWSVAAKTGGSFNGSSFSVTQPTTTLDGSCSAAFVTGRAPTDAAFNANTNGPSENITSVRFTPGGTPIQAIVLDANENARPGTSVTLQLTTNPHGASLAGSTEAVTDASGHATFPGTPNPITLNRIGQGYKLTPRITGTSIGTEQTAAFGIYQEGEPCSAGNSCEVHGRASNVSATISAPPTGGGALGGFVTAQPLIDCPGYAHLTNETIVWVYTGTDTQTVTVLLSRQVIPSRGAAHIDICYLADPHPITGDQKTFVDKLGVVTSGPALLPDCTPAITTNCIVSQNATPGGGRRVIFVVEDGKGRP